MGIPVYKRGEIRNGASSIHHPEKRGFYTNPGITHSIHKKVGLKLQKWTFY